MATLTTATDKSKKKESKTDIKLKVKYGNKAALGNQLCLRTELSDYWEKNAQ